MERVKFFNTYFPLKSFCSLLCVFILSSFSLVQGQTIDELRSEVVSYFNPLEGQVVYQEGNYVLIDRGQRHGLKRGMRFSIFTLGEPYYHPVTKELVGNMEHFNGIVEVQEVSKNTAQARILSQSPSPGDRARITSSPINLAFFQQRDAKWSVADAFYNSLKDSKRFKILETFTPSYEPEDLLKIAKKLGADVFLILSTSGVDNEGVTMEIELFWLDETQPFAIIKKYVTLNSIPQKERLIPLRTDTNEPLFSTSLPDGELIAMGDIEGNGQKNIVISNREKIWIYSFEKGLKQHWVHDLEQQGMHLSLDILDVNKNGKDEIFITSLQDDKKLSSFILEYDELEGYKVTHKELPYFFRVTDNILFMQGFSQKDGFSGPLYEGIFKDGQYKTGRTVALPENLSIYGFTYLDRAGKKPPLFFYIDETGLIYLYENQTLLYKSEKKYNTLSFSFDIDRGALRSKKTSLIRGGIFPVRTEGGTKVLMIHNEPVLYKMKGLGSMHSKLYALFWNGSSMQQKQILSKIKGHVLDYFFDGETLFLLVKPTITMYAKKALSGDIPQSVILYTYKITIQ